MLYLLLMQTGSNTPVNNEIYNPDLVAAAIAIIAALGLLALGITIFSKMNKIIKIIFCLIIIALTAAAIYLTYTVVQQLLAS